MERNIFGMSLAIKVHPDKLARELREKGFEVKDMNKILEKEQKDYIMAKYGTKILENLLRDRF